ncbi:winged helix DNA-binding domain-containing protein [Panus rudis PR-1116 ss-1]|nr:winged helix DNA-binding domain-containing protein [Panus rudis PR-1116 ss-1]
MLEDTSYANVVSWTPKGDAFVVKDMNEFSTTILPRTFKHSNFASFVRQLNKYDFHKIKNSDDDPFGEHSWTFKHPHFRANRKENLEKIKRKGPVARKGSNHRVSDSPPLSSATVEMLQATIERMERTQEEMALHIRHLETNYRNVLNEMVDFQRNQARQDGLLQNLIQYCLTPEAGATSAGQLAS